MKYDAFHLTIKQTKDTEYLTNQKTSELNSERVNYIKNLIKTVSEIDCNKTIFGASSHKYELNPVVSLEDVRKFEKNNGITLPEEYVFFITQVGNGGAGPHYGITPLNINSIDKNLSLTPFARIDMTEKEWNDYLDDDYDDDYDDTNNFEHGVLEVGYQGCTFVTWLVITGNDKGNIVYADLNMDTNKPYFVHMGFLEWFEGWFEEMLKGYSIYNYGYVYNGSQKEIIEKFCNLKSSYYIKEKALISLCKFQSLEPYTKECLHRHYNSDYKLQILQLLLKYDNSFGIQKFEQELESNNPCIAVKSFYRLSKAQKITYYDKMLDVIDKVTPELQEKIICFFSFNEDVSFQVKKFQKYVDNETYPINVRCAALEVMQYATDKHDYLSYFINYLHSDMVELIGSALKVVYLFEDEVLLQEFEYLLKYKNNNKIQTFLTYAFRSQKKNITDYMTMKEFYDNDFVYKPD